MPRTHDQEIFAAGATSPQAEFADGFLGISLKCVTLRPQMRHSAYSTACPNSRDTIACSAVTFHPICSVGLVASLNRRETRPTARTDLDRGGGLLGCGYGYYGRRTHRSPRSKLMDEKSRAKRNAVESEMRAVQMALAHYRAALDLESTLRENV